MLPELLLCILLLSKCNGLILKKIIGNMKSFSKTSSNVQHAALVNTLDAIWGLARECVNCALEIEKTVIQKIRSSISKKVPDSLTFIFSNKQKSCTFD